MLEHALPAVSTGLIVSSCTGWLWIREQIYPSPQAVRLPLPNLTHMLPHDRVLPGEARERHVLPAELCHRPTPHRIPQPTRPTAGRLRRESQNGERRALSGRLGHKPNLATARKHRG